MALTRLRMGSLVDFHMYETGDFDSAFETDQPIQAGPPTQPDHVVRLGDLLNAIYPVGAIYLSTSSTSPSTIFGGTWSRIAEGQFLVGQQTGDSDFGTSATSGGSKTHTHAVNNSSNSVYLDCNNDDEVCDASPPGHSHGNTGNNSALPPFYVVYAWRRTA